MQLLNQPSRLPHLNASGCARGKDLSYWNEVYMTTLTLEFDIRHIVCITNTESLMNIQHAGISLIKCCPPFSGQREKRRWEDEIGENSDHSCGCLRWFNSCPSRFGNAAVPLELGVGYFQCLVVDRGSNSNLMGQEERRREENFLNNYLPKCSIAL